MAMNREAYDYLYELEQIPNWTQLPDKDNRIVKLRKLFTSNEKPDANKRHGGMKVQVTIEGVPIVFDSIAQCASSLDMNKASIYGAMANGVTLKGMLFEELESEEG